MIIEKIRAFVQENNYSLCYKLMGEIGDLIHPSGSKYKFNKCGASQMPLPRYFSFHNIDYYMNHVSGCISKANIGASKGYYIVYLFNLDSTKLYLSLAQATKNKTDTEVEKDTEKYRLLLKQRDFDSTRIIENIQGLLQVNNSHNIYPSASQKYQAKMYELSTMFSIEYDLSKDIDDETFIKDFERFDKLYDYLIEDIINEVKPVQVDFEKIAYFLSNYGKKEYKSTDIGASNAGRAALNEFKKLTKLYSGVFNEEFDSTPQLNWIRGIGKSYCCNYFWNRYYLKNINGKTRLIFGAYFYDENLHLECSLSFRHKDATDLDYQIHQKAINNLKIDNDTSIKLNHNNSGQGYDELTIKINDLIIAQNTSRIVTEICDAFIKLINYYKEMYHTGGAETMSVENKIKELLKKGDVKQIIFTGAPGTGKTYIAKKIASQLGANLKWKNNSDIKYEFVQFHPSYDYTDFVEGLRPIDDQGTIRFAKIDGIFKRFCREVVEQNKMDGNYDKKYYFIIDEINRADFSKVFGELMFCLEKDKRGEANKIQTQYQNLATYGIDNDCFEDGFFIPENVIIIGTMNDIDRSVESMDFALRRRFEWVEFIVDETMLEDAFNSVDQSLIPSYGQIIKDNSQNLAKRIMKLNSLIYSENGLYNEKFGLNRQYYISQGQFANIPNIESINYKGLLEYVWNYRIKSLLKEYLRGENEKDIEAFLNSCYNSLTTEEGV